ncbi:MAG: GAF domain-containing SpoIIE family protein phosphatase [Verrucomicrobiota bacterium]
MIAPAIPHDEQQRLEDLKSLEILETGSEDRFDRITRLASRIFDVPIAYIAMVDTNRQWFKSEVGLNACETSREVSFCGHTILKNAPLIISDASKDDRFFDNPMVTGEPNIRFYAGRPLKGPNGHNVGTLCLADQKPREFCDEELKQLEDLSLIVEKELHFHDLVQLQEKLLTTQSVLLQKQKQMAEELKSAAAYVRHLLPEPLSEPVDVQWIFTPSTELAGDSFSYKWIDDEHFLMFLIDVAGHGVSSALLSTSVLNYAKSMDFAEMDFDLGTIVNKINNAFPAENHDGRFFSMWIGIYQKSSRLLRYVNGGHPSPFLLRPRNESVLPLEVSDLLFGILEDHTYKVGECTLEAGDQLLVFSDGIYEIRLNENLFGDYDDFYNIIQRLNKEPTLNLEALVEHQKERNHSEHFDDDISIVIARFS